MCTDRKHDWNFFIHIHKQLQIVGSKAKEQLHTSINHTTFWLHNWLFTTQLASWSHSHIFVPYIEILYSAICEKLLNISEAFPICANRYGVKVYMFSHGKIKAEALFVTSVHINYSMYFTCSGISQKKILISSTWYLLVARSEKTCFVISARNLPVQKIEN